MRAAAVFDLDGTLLVGTSAERLLVPYLFDAGVIGVRQLGWALGSVFFLPVLGYHRAVRANKRYLRGIAVADVVHHMAEFVDGVLGPRLCPAVVARLEALRDGGYLTCLLTGAPAPVARAMVRSLRMADGLGTELEEEGGQLTGRIGGLHYFGTAKRSGVEELAARHDINLADSIAFADRASDVAFLECFGHAVVVNAPTSLRREARRRGWELLDP